MIEDAMQIDLIVAPCVRSPFARVPFLGAPDHRVDLAPRPYGAGPVGIEHVGRGIGDVPPPAKRLRARRAARRDGVTPAMVDGLAFLRRANRMLSRWIDHAADVDGKRRAAVWARWLSVGAGRSRRRADGCGPRGMVLGADMWGPADGSAERRRLPEGTDVRAARLWDGLAAVAIRSCRTEADAAEAPSLLFEQVANGKRIGYPIAYVASAARRHERTRERRAAARRAAKDAVAAGYLAAASDPRHAVMISRAEGELGDLLRAYAAAKEQGQEEPMRTVERKRARLLADLERRARAILADSAV